MPMTMNGRIHGEVKDAVMARRELIQQRLRLRLLDGVLRYFGEPLEAA